jgi:protease I
MANALFIIAQQGFRDEELLIPLEILKKSGIICTVASITTDVAVGKLGATINPDISVADANINDYDIVIVIGGPGAPQLATYNEVIDLLRLAKENKKKLAAICIAPTVLAKAGVLGGKKATVFFTPESRKALETRGATYVDKDVVVDGDIVTGNGPAAAKKFAEEIVKILKK